MITLWDDSGKAILQLP